MLNISRACLLVLMTALLGSAPAAFAQTCPGDPVTDGGALYHIVIQQHADGYRLACAENGTPAHRFKLEPGDRIEFTQDLAEPTVTIAFPENGPALFASGEDRVVVPAGASVTLQISEATEPGLYPIEVEGLPSGGDGPPGLIVCPPGCPNCPCS
jgi:hypothetical protein